MNNKPLALLFLAVIGLLLTYRSRAQTTDREGMVLIPQGIFVMGIDSAERASYTARFHIPESFFANEYPTIKMSVSSFYLDKYEVTNADFKRFIEDNPEWAKTKIARNLQDGNYLKAWTDNTYPKGKASYPVTYVSWYAAIAYARWIGKRLPTESEREYVVKLGQKGPMFPSGDAGIDKLRANYSGSGIGQTSKVGHYPANALGIYDLAGNVAEMTTENWYPNRYAEHAKTIKDVSYTSAYKISPDSMAVHGGSWVSAAVELLPAHRTGHAKTECSPYIGFRCAANAPIKH